MKNLNYKKLTLIMAFSFLVLWQFCSFSFSQTNKVTENKTITGEQILDKYIEATGGKKAYDKIKNRLTKGMVEIPAAGIKLELTVYSAKPNKLYTLVKSKEIGDTESGTDGKIFWEKTLTSGPRILEGTELTEAQREAVFDKDVHWKKVYAKAEFVGMDSVDTNLCYKVIMHPKEGKPQTFFFDQKSYLLVKTEAIVETQMGSVPLQTFFGDYKKVDGILISHRATIKVIGQDQLITWQSIEHNIKMPEDIFKIPEDIKKLMEKK